MAMSGWVINKDLGGQTDASDWDITNVNGHLVFVTGNPETDNDDLLVSPIPSMAVNGIIMPSRVSRNQVLIHFMLMALSTLVRRKILDSMFPIRYKCKPQEESFTPLLELYMAIFTKVIAEAEINTIIRS